MRPQRGLARLPAVVRMMWQALVRRLGCGGDVVPKRWCGGAGVSQG